ncbi:alanine--tRNA ligase [Paludibaculum fermentans]|uniref:Alanine--tRNA ligase n=1 Tax=Paludibaculum fermentans TaxID=1473598 RepID=A0A7S7NTR6_PALFE|nr:alanine--tRNA ligase [Paludibaculum fermentans]QOY89672.1 alanine--tRNA ligase [Paludibaculum fermentans]
MTGHEIRQKFLDFFAARNHRVVRSSSLVPGNDPTLLFTNAGMNQFKDVFTGLEQRDYSRATTAQKCVRAGGKHNDLENVGYTRRHHTFFEMMGNFSFGDYFKTDAIDFAWDLVTNGYGLPKDRLYVTVFREDDEAEELWQKVAGVPKDRIFRLDEKDNFWQMGETGPCGPCSEIHFDLGEHTAAPGREHEKFPDDGGGRFVEIWNLVFMQFDRDLSGKFTPLPRPSIDTGMGLERVAAIMQGKLSNFECDLLYSIVEEAGNLLGKSVGEDTRTDTVLRICADHARATAFLINDGVLPSNEGRGYVLRKIMRRAMRNARMIGSGDPFLYKLTGFVADFMKGPYPDMLESVQRVARVVKDEEHRYATTFQVAEKVFHDEARSAAGGVLPGPAAFKLYDTYGMALDEQEEMARELGLSIDVAGYEDAMQKQRERARASWKGAEKAQIAPIYQELLGGGRTQFLGYETLEHGASQVLAILVDQQRVDSVGPETECEIVLDRTPFYAESGGQVGDTGILVSPETGEPLAYVTRTYPAVPGLTVHKARSLGELKTDQLVAARVNDTGRFATMRNHTATHLAHAALRQVLGKHVKQAGSVVEPGRLRFDFSHYTAVDAQEVAEVERLANEQILLDVPVTTDVMELDKAIDTGAMALFGEKYGEKVRVVSVPGFSRELCGGTHVHRTGEIGLLKVVYEGSISAGVRRIEAVTGASALKRFQETTDTLHKATSALRTSESEFLDQIDRLLAQQKTLERQIETLKEKVAHAAAAGLESQVREVKGVKILSAVAEGMDRAQMRNLADDFRNRWKSAVILLASGEEGNVAIVTAVTKDLTAKVHAGKLAGSIAQAVGGKGGGRPDMAEAGGKDAAALPAALAAASASVEGML